MATRSSILAWRVPGTEESGGQQSMGRGAGHAECARAHAHTSPLTHAGASPAGAWAPQARRGRQAAFPSGVSPAFLTRLTRASRDTTINGGNTRHPAVNLGCTTSATSRSDSVV